MWDQPSGRTTEARPDRISLSPGRKIGLAEAAATGRATPVLPMTPSLKKSESLEIRIPHATKQAFMARCQAQGQSASEALRGFIEAQLTPVRPASEGRRVWRLVAGALVAAAVGAAALPSLARPSLASEFQRLDVDGDQRLSVTEFGRLDANGDGVVSLAEYGAGAGR